MRWKQFFTPVKSMNTDEAREYISSKSGDAFTLLDVRQPNEYQFGHIPGARLIPLGELNDRLNEVDPQNPTIVYCAIGGRSRVASQMLAGKGFKEVYNLTGGIKAWRDEKALGPEDTGLDLFSGNESPAETLVVAYALEAGLRDFYVSMRHTIKNENARKLFEKLADIEKKHQDRIFEEYLKVARGQISQAAFEKEIVTPAVEGGVTTEEYINIYQPDLEKVEEILSLAMAIEAQALDLYQRAAEKAGSSEKRAALMQIADEERVHIAQLGKLFESL